MRRTERVVVLAIYDGPAMAHELQELPDAQLLRESFNVVAASDEYFSEMEKDSFGFSQGDVVAEIEVEVSPTIAERLLAHGTSEQYYGDGYEAWDAIRKGRGKIISVSVEEWGAYDYGEEEDEYEEDDEVS